MRGDPKLGEVGTDQRRRKLRVVQWRGKDIDYNRMYLGCLIQDGPALVRHNGCHEYGDWNGDRPCEREENVRGNLQQPERILDINEVRSEGHLGWRTLHHPQVA